jgi:hypothetical protein
MLLEAVGYGVVLPAAVAAIIVALFRGAIGSLPRTAGALALAAGFCTGFFTLGLGNAKPTYYWDWLPAASVVLVATSAVDLLPRLRWLVRPLEIVAVSLAAAWFLIPNFPSLQATRNNWVVGLASAIGILWIGVGTLARRETGPRLPLAFMAVALSAGALLMLSDSARFTQMVGVLAGVLAGTAALAWFRPKPQPFTGMAAGFAVVLAALLIDGYLSTYSDIPLACFVMVLAAPLLLWLRQFRPVAKLAGLKRILVAELPMLLVLAAALAVAWRAAPPSFDV